MVPTHFAHLAVTLITMIAKWSDNLLELQKKACVALPIDNAQATGVMLDPLYTPAKKPHAKIQYDVAHRNTSFGIQYHFTHPALLMGQLMSPY